MAKTASGVAAAKTGRIETPAASTSTDAHRRTGRQRSGKQQRRRGCRLLYRNSTTF